MSNLRIERIDGGTRMVVLFSDELAPDVQTRLFGPRPSNRPPPPPAATPAVRLPPLPRPPRFG